MSRTCGYILLSESTHNLDRKHAVSPRILLVWGSKGAQMKALRAVISGPMSRIYVHMLLNENTHSLDHKYAVRASNISAAGGAVGVAMGAGHIDTFDRIVALVS